MIKGTAHYGSSSLPKLQLVVGRYSAYFMSAGAGRKRSLLRLPEWTGTFMSFSLRVTLLETAESGWRHVKIQSGSREEPRSQTRRYSLL